MLLKLAAAALLLTAPVSVGATELIVNGGFENGLTGWLVQADVAALSGHDYVQYAGGGGSAAAQANHFASFGSGNSANFNRLSQNFTPEAGKVYTVSFDYGTFGRAEDLDYLFFGIGPSGMGTLSPVSTTNLDALFTHFTQTFTGTGTLSAIVFSAHSSIGDAADPLVDNVSVTTVPDAPTWALFVVGFGLIGVTARRRAVATA